MKPFKEYKNFGSSERITLNCYACGEDFQRYKCLMRKNPKVNKHFCSKECWCKKKSEFTKAWNKGLTKETDSRLSYARPTSFQKGLSPWNKGKEFLAVRGSNNNFWKGGVTPLNTAIRFLKESKNWKKSILSRDNYTCVECKSHGVKFHVDHIKRFADVVKEFLSEYNQFSPHEDKETLLRLARTYKPFFDLSNGRTLCVDCHKKTPSYLKR